MKFLSSKPPVSLAFAAALSLLSVSAAAQEVKYSSTHRDHEHALPQTVTGGTAKLRAKISAARGVSVVVADFDSDGTQDIVSGYATSTGGALLLQRGSPVATAPTPKEWAMTAAGQLVAPYVEKAEPLELPVRPELLRTADISGHGHADLIAAQNGDTALYVSYGDGSGSFAAPKALALAGTVSSVATWRSAGGDTLLVAGVCGSRGCGLQFLDRDGVTLAFIPTAGAVTAIETGRIDNGRRDDLAIIAGNTVQVLDGDTALAARPTLETLPVSGATALALGLFVPDHHPGLQVAVLSADATLHVITRAGIDASYDPNARHAQNLARAQSGGVHPAAVPLVKRTGQPWTEAETVFNVGPGGPAILLRARLSGSGNDDLAVLAGSQYVTVAHPVTHDSNTIRTTPVVTIDSTSAPAVAAVAARVSADARLGIVTLAGTGVHPLTLSVPAAYRTIYVSNFTSGTGDAAVNATSISACKANTSTSGVGCTLRAAITVANLDRGSTGTAKVDTINIPAVTITLSALNTNSTNATNGNYNTQNPDYLDSVNYHLELDAAMNLVGAGCTLSGSPATPTSCSTIINAHQIDQVMALDFGSFYATGGGDYESASADFFLSGMTLENGKNPNTYTGNCADLDCNVYGGNLQWTAEPASNLVLNHVLITSGTSGTENGGGGISTFEDPTNGTTAGPLEIDNSTISYNSEVTNQNNEGGGGIVVEYQGTNVEPLILTNDLITQNTSVNQGAGLFVSENPGQVTITGTTFSNNTATGTLAVGGGMSVFEAPLNVTGSTFSGNKATAFGGGVHLANLTNLSYTLNSNTFTSNSLNGSGSGYTYNADGAGVCAQASPTSGDGVYTLQYNRFHGNAPTGTTTPRSSGLGVGCDVNGTNYATVTATDNWWGCNPTTSGSSIAGTNCDTAAVGNGGSPTLSTAPYTKLTLALNATTLAAGTSLVATASLGQDSNGTIYGSSAYLGSVGYAPDAAYLATPITTFTTTLTGTNNYNPSATAFSATAATGTSYAAATDAATTNATGNGTATLTVDGFTVTQAYTVTAPDLNVTSTHTGNFKAGDTGDTYTLTVGNVGNSSTSATVTVTDTPPSGFFTATALSGPGWTCTLGTLTCTRSDALAPSVTYPAITLTVSVASADAGTYTNNVAVSGGGEVNTANDTATDSTNVVGKPTLAQAFSPTTVAPNATSTLTFTVGNPSANPVSLTGVAFSATLQSGLTVATAAATTCSGGTATGSATSVSLSGATIAAGATCTVTIGLKSPTFGSYSSTAAAPTATNSNAGTAPAVATFTVNVTPTQLVYTNTPDTPITAGGNSGAIQVALEDGAGNVATNNSTSVVTLTVTSTGYTTTTYTATASNGVANFSAVTLTLAGTYTYTASASSLTSGMSTEIVNAGAFYALSGIGPTSFTAPAQTGTITLKAIDSYGNTVTSFTGTVTLTSNDPLATLPAAYTYIASDNGVHTFTYSFGTAGTARTLTATSGSVVLTQTGITVNDCILFINSNGTLSRLTDAGIATSPSGGYTGGGAPTIGIAVDSTGDIWSVNTSSSVLAEFSKAGTALSGSGYTGGGLSAPNAVAIDGLGFVWVVNGNNTLSVFTNLGAAVSTATNYITVTGGTGSNSIAIDISGNLWISNATNSTITEILGGAAPTPPLAIGVSNATTGTRP